MSSKHRFVGLILSLLLCLTSLPALAQVERSNDASLLLRAASFGATIGTNTTYLLSEYQPDHWVVQAQTAPPSKVNWAVTQAPMGGARAGYIVFVNGDKETLTIDVLKIDECYGTTGEIRIGW